MSEKQRAAWTPNRRIEQGARMRAVHQARKLAGDPMGFAAMPDCLRKEIASLGGRAVQEKGTGHRWTTAEARAAGKKGGDGNARRLGLRGER